MTMAIGVDQLYLSMTSPETGDYLTGNVYTVDGVYEADGVTPRRLSIGQLVMAICLARATALESGSTYTDPATGDVKSVDGIIQKMAKVEQTSEMLECLTTIENAVLSSSVNLTEKKITYQGKEYTYFNFLANVAELGTVPSTANKDSEEFLEAIEAKMDENNTFSQQTMIELQSLTNKRDQSYDMISNVLKSLNTVLVGTANNI